MMHFAHEDIDNAFDAGVKAAKRGDEETDNPFDRNTEYPLYLAWKRGWHLA